MTINVDFSVHATRYHIEKDLMRLNRIPILSFDIETKGVYSKSERKEALKLLTKENIPVAHRRLALQVANNSGLSFPSLVSVTHFIFGESKDKSTIYVVDNPSTEYFIWSWLASYPGLLLIHNTLFDLKVMYNRVKAYPRHYEDTQLLAKSLTNHVDVWKSRVGLKDLMGSYYDPKWTLIDEYEPTNLKDPAFLRYASIDGAATYKLWEDLQEHCNE